MCWRRVPTWWGVSAPPSKRPVRDFIRTNETRLSVHVARNVRACGAMHFALLCQPLSQPGTVGAAKRSFLEVAAASCNRTHAVATFVVDAAECNERGCRFQYHLRAKIVSNVFKEHPHARSGRSAIQRLGHFGPKFDLCDFFRLFGESSRGIRARRSNVRPNARIGHHVEKSAPSVLLRQMLDNAQRRTHARSAAHTPFGSANRGS